MKERIEFDDVDKYGPQRFSGTLQVPAEELDRDEITGMGEIELEVEARKAEAPGEYELEGAVAYTADVVCSRCLEAFPFANRSSFAIRYRPRPATPVAEEEREISGEELDVEYYVERAVPVRELAIEQIQLSIPMKTLCEEACHGLCPQCGKNWNRESCDCAEPAADQRWDALRSVREELIRKKNS